MTWLITDPVGTIRLMTPFVIGAMFAAPLLYIALALRTIKRHAMYQTALIEGRVRPAARVDPKVDELDEHRRRRVEAGD